MIADDLRFQANPGGGLEAAVKNALSSFILGDITHGRVVPEVERRVQQAVIGEVNRLFGRRGTRLPDGVVLSMRGIDHLPTGVRAWGALGAFGSIVDRFPKQSTSSGTCGSQVLAMQAGPVVALAALRAFRDERLPLLPEGPVLRDAYYHHTPEVVRLLLSHPRLAARARRSVVRGQHLLLSGPLPGDLIAEIDAVLRDVYRHASTALRSDIDRIRDVLLPALHDAPATQ